MKNTIKSIKEIDSVFRGKTVVGKSVLIKYSDSDSLKYLVTAPIKTWKRAVDRNRIKRLMRESIRGIEIPKNIAFVYIDKEIRSLVEIKKDIEIILKKIKY